MIADEFISLVTPLLKKSGFRKTRTTWRKNQGESVAVFNIQKSQWDSNDFYLNVGLYYSDLGNEINPAENQCHLRTRIEVGDLGLTIEEALIWFSSGASLKDAKRLLAENPERYLAVKELQSASTT